MVIWRIVITTAQVLFWAVETLFDTMLGIWDAALSNIDKGLKDSANTHGDADWTSWEKLEKHGHFKRQGWLIGEIYRPRFWRWGRVSELIYTLTDASGLAIAAKGEGKSQTAIAQLKDIATRRTKDDVVVVDPAGDLRAGSEAAFREAGYRVLVIDANDTANSVKYDPMTVLRVSSEDDYDRDVEQMCRLILPDDSESQNPHFQEFARKMLMGMTAFQMENDRHTTTLNSVVMDLTTSVDKRMAIFTQMRQSANPLVQQAVSAYDEAGSKERGSFSTTMARKLGIWLRVPVRKLTQHDVQEGKPRDRGWTWEQVFMDDIPTVVFVISGLGTGEGPLARLILGNAINTRRYMYNAMRTASRSERVQFSRGLRLFVDEAKELGRCEAIMDANNTLRKAGVSTMMYWLSSRDVFHTYGDDAVTLIQNSDLFVFGGSKEKSWSEDLSWLVGDMTIANPGGSQNDNGVSHSYSEQARRVIKSDEIRRMPFEQMLYISSRVATRCFKPFEIKENGVVHFYGDSE